MNKINNSINIFQGNYCKSAKAYSFLCNLNGVKLDMPYDCMTCSDVSGGTFNAGETNSFDTESTELVFILQESSCLRYKTVFLLLDYMFLTLLKKQKSQSSIEQIFPKIFEKSLKFT